MSKVGEDIVAGLKEAIDHVTRKQVGAREHVVRAPEEVDVRAIRRRLGMTQKEFARQHGFSLGSIRNWEQGHRRPEGPARALLTIIDREPEAVQRALAPAAGD